MVTFFCDLDNTIIYSHRKEMNSPKLVAEMINGTIQSYITEKTFRFLSSCRSVSIIPVTTRTRSQYRRLDYILDCFNCESALILNGAVLMNRDTVDEKWLIESRHIAEGSIAEMEKAAKLLGSIGNTPLRYYDEFLAYSVVAEPDRIAEQIESMINTSLVHVFCDYRKVYCIPATIDKGNSIKRIFDVMPPGLSIGVGDSENDLSMLETVDIPVVPETLSTYILNPRKVVVPQSEILSDVACDVIEKLSATALRI